MRNEPGHPLPLKAILLTPAAQGAVPQFANAHTETSETFSVARHSEVPHIPSHHGSQILPLLRDGLMHASAQLLFDRPQLGAHALGVGQPQDRELPFAGLPTTVCKAQEVKGRRLTPISTSAVLARKAPELNQPRLVFVQLQAEVGQPFSNHMR